MKKNQLTFRQWIVQVGPRLLFLPFTMMTLVAFVVVCKNVIGGDLKMATEDMPYIVLGMVLMWSSAFFHRLRNSDHVWSRVLPTEDDHHG